MDDNLLSLSNQSLELALEIFALKNGLTEIMELIFCLIQ